MERHLRGHVYGQIPKRYLRGGKKPAWMVLLEHPKLSLWSQSGSFFFLQRLATQIESSTLTTSSGRKPALLALAVAGASEPALKLTYADTPALATSPAHAVPSELNPRSTDRPQIEQSTTQPSVHKLVDLVIQRVLQLRAAKMISQGASSSSSMRPQSQHPSVLRPNRKIPTLSYAEATSFLHAHNAASAAALLVPFPLPDREVDICIYDPIGMCLKVWNSGEMVLTDNTTLRNLVVELQGLIDRCCFDLDMEEKYLILDIEMRVLNNGNMVGFPRIVGEPKWVGDERDGKKGAVVDGVIWLCDGGDMEQYWDAYRRMMQIGDAEGGIKKPMLKIRTLRKVDVGVGFEYGMEGMGMGMMGGEEFFGGHFFVRGITGSVREVEEEGLFTVEAREENASTKSNRKGKEKASQGQIDLETTTIADDMATIADKEVLAECQRVLLEEGNPLGIKENELEFALKLIGLQKVVAQKAEQKKSGNGEGSSNDVPKPDVFKTYNSYLGNGGKPLPEVTMNMGKGQEKDRPVDPTRNWGYYQRMGGDPVMHKAFPLDAVPFEEHEFKLVGPDDPEYPDGGSDVDTVKSLGDGADTSIKMVPYMTPQQFAEAAELAERQKIKPSFPEAAIGFDEEDDKIFCPNVDKPPSPVMDPKKAAALKALRGAAPQHKKVETLRAIGLDKVLAPPVVPQSSLHNSAYLNALGSSGLAPPAGAYNSFSSLATNQPFGFQQPTTHPNTIGHSPLGQSPFGQYSTMSHTPTLGFYDTMGPGVGSSNTGMGNTGMRSPLSNIARTSSRIGFQPTHGGGTPLRADSPAFRSSSSAGKQPTYPPPAYGLQGQAQQQGSGVSQSGVPGSGSGAQLFDYNGNVDALSTAAKKWFTD